MVVCRTLYIVAFVCVSLLCVAVECRRIRDRMAVVSKNTAAGRPPLVLALTPAEDAKLKEDLAAWLLTNGDNMPTAHDTRMFIMKWYLNMWHVKVAAIRRRLGLRPNANTILV